MTDLDLARLKQLADRPATEDIRGFVCLPPQELAALLDRVERAEAALRTVQKSLQAADADSLLGDVIWRVDSPNETLFDFVTATLEPSS